VAGESIFGFLPWRRSNQLRDIQTAENLEQGNVIERLKTESEQQRERAAKAESNASEAKKTAAAAGIDASKASERAAKAELGIAAQQERAAKAEKDLLELKRQLTPRIITSEQTVRLLEILRQSAKGPVTVLTHGPGDSEAGAFASDIRNVLSAAGWAASFAQSSGSARRGVGIGIRSRANPPAHAAILQRAFESVGISMGGFEDARIAEGVVEIDVGPKP